MGAKGKGIRKYRVIMYSIGNVVNNIVITMYGARWVLRLSGGSLHKLHNCLSLCCIPETSIKMVKKADYILCEFYNKCVCIYKYI